MVALLSEGLHVRMNGGGASLQQFLRHIVLDARKHIDVPNAPVEGVFDGIHRLGDAYLQAGHLEGLLLHDLHYEEAQFLDAASS